MKKEKNDTIYIGTLYRFGYELTAAEMSEDDVKKIIMDEYIIAYEKYNDGDDPREIPYDEYGDDEETTMYDEAIEDIEIMELTIGKVEWR